MVLKSLGKKLKSVLPGKKKDKTEDKAPPKVVGTAGTKEGGIGGNALPLYGWKGGPKLTGKKDKGGDVPKVVGDGGKTEDVKPKVIAPKTETEAPKTEARPTWKAPTKDDAPGKGPITIGTGRKVTPKGKVEETPKVEETKVAPKEEKKKNPYVTSNPYTTESDLKSEGDNEISSSSSGGTASGSDVGGGEEAGVGMGLSKYFRQNDSGSSPYGSTAKIKNGGDEKSGGGKQVGGGMGLSKYFREGDVSSTPYGTRIVGEEQKTATFSITEHSEEKKHQILSEGTSAFQHSKPGEVAKEKAPVVVGDDSDSSISDPLDGPKVEAGGYGYKAKGGGQDSLVGGNEDDKKKYLDLAGEESDEEKLGKKVVEEKAKDVENEGGDGDEAKKYLTLGDASGEEKGGGEEQGGGKGLSKYFREGDPSEEKPNKYLVGEDQSGSTGGKKKTNYHEAGSLDSDVQSSSTSSSVEFPVAQNENKMREVKGKLPDAPEVQGVAPESKDEGVSKMQSKLRDNTKHNVDVPEKLLGREIAVTRGKLSDNEKGSKGWGMLPMRDTYRNRRDGTTGKISKGLDRNLGGTGATQYFISKGDQLEYEARKVLASNLKAGRGTKREDTVIRFAGGKWVDAGGNDIDTNHVKALTYSVNELVEKLTKKLNDPKIQGVEKKLLKVQTELKGLINKKTQEEQTKKSGIAGRYIFVMNASGEFFAGQSITGVVHHSSFMAGGAVACAGEVAISGGTLTAISNTSGHYRPGPVYLWQAVKQLEMLGVPLTGLRVDVMGAKKNFKNAAEFIGAMDPTSDPMLFDAGYAIDHLNNYFDEKSKNKVKEEVVIKSGEEQKDKHKGQIEV